MRDTTIDRRVIKLDCESERELSIKPVKRETGFYDVKLKSEDRDALTYLINRAARTLKEDIE